MQSFESFTEGHLNLEWKSISKAVSAEFLGCLFTNLFACGTALATNNYGYSMYKVPLEREHFGHFVHGQDYQSTMALAFGVAFGINVALFQMVSGAHVNPSITLGMVIVKNMGWVQGLLYIPAQFLGAICGSALLKVLVPEMGRTDMFLIKPYTKHGMTEYHAIVWEIILAMQLMLVYIQAREESLTATKSAAPIIIGCAVMNNHLAGLYIVGGTCNPAQTIAASIMSNDFEHFWVFLVFSPVGAAIGAVLHYTVFKPEPEEEEQFKRKLTLIRQTNVIE